MRKYLVAAAVSLALSACASGPPPLPEPTPAERMTAIVAEIDDLRERVKTLESNVDRFDYDDWREVVPDVRSDSESLSFSVETLGNKAFDLEQELIRTEEGGYDPPEDPR